MIQGMAGILLQHLGHAIPLAGKGWDPPQGAEGAGQSSPRHFPAGR